MQKTAAQYGQIAWDLAGRIARGEMPEGEKLYGRSVLASEYSVSPETIRRALRLLSDMKVVEVKPQSGARVLSRDSARRYLEAQGEDGGSRALRAQVQELLEQYGQLNRRMVETVAALIQTQETFSSAHEPLPSYEISVPQDSPLLGRSIGGLQFWQHTGGTIAAIRRGPAMILSPGPQAELYAGDVVVVVGTPAAAGAARTFVTGKEHRDDLL